MNFPPPTNGHESGHGKALGRKKVAKKAGKVGEVRKNFAEVFVLRNKNKRRNAASLDNLSAMECLPNVYMKTRNKLLEYGTPPKMEAHIQDQSSKNVFCTVCFQMLVTFLR